MRVAGKAILAMSLCLSSAVTFAQDGTSPPKSPEEFLQAPAEKGEAFAQDMLVGIYAGRKDYKSAFFWAQKAADQGDAPGESLLGEMYENGFGVPRDYEQARQWLHKAAGQHNETAEQDLAQIYYRGEGVRQDYAESLRWYLRVAGHEDVKPEVPFIIGMMYYQGQGTRRDYQQALTWLLKSAEQSYAAAESMVGIMYYQGTGTRRDTAKGKDWELRAASHGSPDSYAVLGAFYYNWKPENDVEARKWFLKATTVENSNTAIAEYDLGLLNYYGQGGPRDLVAARTWFLRAAQRGDVTSQYDLGRMMCMGEGGPRDFPECRGWFLKAAGQGYAEAKYNLGVMYHNGMGVPVDYGEARRWFLAAAAQGNADAQRALAQGSGSRSKSPSGSNTFGRMLCNKALGTSMSNIMSPCNYQCADSNACFPLLAPLVGTLALCFQWPAHPRRSLRRAANDGGRTLARPPLLELMGDGFSNSRRRSAERCRMPERPSSSVARSPASIRAEYAQVSWWRHARVRPDASSLVGRCSDGEPIPAVSKFDPSELRTRWIPAIAASLGRWFRAISNFFTRSLVAADFLTRSQIH